MRPTAAVLARPVLPRRLRPRGALAGATLALAALVGAGAQAANAPFPTVTTPVKLDTRVLASASWYEALNTIVYEAGTYHMWYVNPDLTGVRHATSADGINFTTLGGDLTLPANWWTAYGATVQPQINYLRVSRDGGGNWILMIWHPNGANQGQFNYNTSLWLLGSDIDNTAPTLIGPLPISPGGNHVGPFGIVGDHLYLGQDTAQAFGRYLLTPSTTSSPPTTWPAGMVDAANAYAGTGLCSFATCPGDPNSSYIHNYGRTLDQGGVLGTYYTLYNYNTWTRRSKQLWYMESTDGGDTWGSAQPLFTDGNAVTVDGLPNAGNFSLPEVTALGGGQYRTYFNTRDACGNFVTVTAPLAGTQQGLTVTKGFSPSTVAPGGSSQLTVTLTAPAATCAPAPTTPIYTGLGFTDTLPAGMTLAAAPAASTTCAGATLAATGGADSFSLSGASLAPGASCTATVTVAVAGAGTFRNVISASMGQPGAVTNDQAVPALADAIANLQAGIAPVAPVPTLGEAALMAMGLLLGAMGLRRLRPARRS